MEIWSGNENVDSAVAVPGIDAWVHSEPCEGQARGGDIHYVSMCGAGKLSRFAVADVAGHGVAVGHLAVRLRQLMRKHINTLDQTQFARALNREFRELAQEGRFATALLTSYFAPTDHLVICNAGHPRPLWYSARTQTWQLLAHDMPERATSVVNLPLGVIEPTEYVQFAVSLGQGDLVVIYTDALIESTDADGKQLGERGLLDLVRGLDVSDPPNLSPNLLAAIDERHGGADVEDDRTVLMLRHNAADPPKRSLAEKMRVMGKMLGLIGY
jgi:serine phosphatase RsbU (regulator of sigma subunit)